MSLHTVAAHTVAAHTNPYLARSAMDVVGPQMHR